jgi:RNA polymerase sigma-70 factor, ECF subfamily
MTNLRFLTDAELYTQLTAGDEEALGTLYDRYGNLVYRLALRMLTVPQESEDLTQEIFLTLWRVRGYDPTRGSLSNYLMTLTRSRAIDRLRTRQSTVRFLQRWGKQVAVGTPVVTPFEQASVTERAQRVKEALANLPESQRQVVEMAYYEGLTQAEIAERLQTPLGTIKSRGRHALVKLKQYLSDFIG